MSRVLRAGTRSSTLAFEQVEIVRRALGSRTAIEACAMTTSGDRLGMTPGGDGIFVKEIQRALQDGEIDCAVHSLKDLPTEACEGLMIAAVLERADPRDALVGVTLEDLKPGMRVGTGSARRAAQLCALRPEIEIVPIRGNVATRVQKVADGQADAVVLALAGLTRIGMQNEAAHIFSVDEMAPAPGQGAIALETRAEDHATRELLAPLDHSDTRRAVEAERAVLRALGGGCLLPVGAFGLVREGTLHLQARVVSSDGSAAAEASASGTNDAAVAHEVAQLLIARHALELLHA